MLTMIVYLLLSIFFGYIAYTGENPKMSAINGMTCGIWLSGFLFNLVNFIIDGQ